MREYRRRSQDLRARMRLSRAADGRLRPAMSDDISDVWAEQRRIRLREAIDEDKRKASKKGGWHSFFRQRKAVGSPAPSDAGNSPAKVVEIKISLPSKLPTPKLPKLRLRQANRKFLWTWGVVIVAAGLAYGGWLLLADKSEVAQKGSATSETLGAANQGAPEYKTLLPEGETIEALGGWGRVSPPDKEPVFAYVDSIGGVSINVSQQPLPEHIRKNVGAEMAKLAEQFSAHKKIVAGDTTVYIGTSLKGPQSVVLTKGDLLILIRSASKLTDQQWFNYVVALQ